VSPLRGEKPQNWPLSKLNTGRFALRAMLPVISDELMSIHHHHHHNHFMAFFPDHPGEPVPEENFWTLWCKGRLTETRHTNHSAGRHSVWTNQCPPPPSPIFYRLDALPAAQPTVSKH